MPKQSTERVDPLAAVGLTKKTDTGAGATQMIVSSAPAPAPAQPIPAEHPSPSLERSAAPERQTKEEDERATEKVTAYFTPPQYDHIDELRRQYRKRTKQRISVNALLRRLVEHANLEDILPN